MLRRFIYTCICSAAVALVFWSDSRGWDPFDYVAMAATGAAFGGAFVHK